MRHFLREILDDHRCGSSIPAGQVWTVRGNRHTVLATSTWGTSRYPAPAARPGRAGTAPHRGPRQDRRRRRWVLNVDATLAAQEKAAELAGRFSDWAWENPARAAELARTYNDRFNNLVLRSYDDAQLSLPGLALTFRPHPHQVAAVARIIHEPAVLLAHEVGAGKTAEMTMGVDRAAPPRPGPQARHRRAEPHARAVRPRMPPALPAGPDPGARQREDLQRDRRRQFAARCATGDWDGSSCPAPASSGSRSAPTRTGTTCTRTGPDARTSSRLQEGDGLTVKRLEAALLRAEERLRAKLDSAKDPGITFEATGIDYLLRRRGPRVQEPPHPLQHHRRRHRRVHARHRPGHEDRLPAPRATARRVVTFATATPIANSITEAYVMQRYLRPDLLDAAGHRPFRHLGRHLRPDGHRSWRWLPKAVTSPGMKSRFARFCQRAGTAPQMARLSRRQDRRGPRAARPRAGPARRRRAARTRDRRRPAI